MIIKNGTLLDGTGNPGYQSDLAVIGSEIAAINKHLSSEAHLVIDATDRVVCPGFIDIHTHSDLVLRSGDHQYAKAFQGVTTEVIGLDGLSYAPASPENLLVWKEYLAALNGKPDIEWNWSSIHEFLDGFNNKSPANIAYLVPHGALRMEIVGMQDRSLSKPEMKQMRSLLEDGLHEGAMGLSTALTYVPCCYAPTSELVALAEVLADQHGFFAIHWRRSGSDLLEPLEEVIEIGRQSGAPVHISHLQVSWEQNKGQSSAILKRIDEARLAGIDITFDAYPYIYGNSMLSVFLPAWAWSGGPEQLLQRLADKTIRETIISSIEPLPVGWDRIVLTNVPSAPVYEGKTIQETADSLNVSAAELICEFLYNEKLAVTFMMQNGNEEDLQNILVHEAGMIASDGILLGTKPHPRGYGTFPRIFSQYVRQNPVMEIQDAVRRMTSFPANRLGLLDRGVLRPGFAADLTLFDPDVIADTANYQEGKKKPVGIDTVIVNGVPIIYDGEPTDYTPGITLKPHAAAVLLKESG